MSATVQAAPVPSVVSPDVGRGGNGGAPLRQIGDCKCLEAVRYAVGTLLHYERAETEYVGELTREDLPLRLEARGGGGTDFRPVFAALEEQGEAPAALVYLTDLCGPFPEVEPDFPVLWVSTSDREAPFGETVKLRIDR